MRHYLYMYILFSHGYCDAVPSKTKYFVEKQNVNLISVQYGNFTRDESCFDIFNVQIHGKREMAVRLAPPDAIRTLYAIQCVTKDLKPSQSSYCMNTQEMYKLGNLRCMSRKSPTDSIRCKSSGSSNPKQNPKERGNVSSDNALVHKVHPDDRPLRNNVQERAKCTELDDILAKWNVYKPKK